MFYDWPLKEAKAEARMNPNCPYVATAALCDFVLHEKDERISCIRFLDTVEVTISPDAPDPLPPVTLEIRGLLSFKSGEFTGTKTLKIEPRGPSGELGKPAQTFPLTFKGNEHGANLILRLIIPISQEGLYYFDVSLDEEMVTRIPLRVRLKLTKPADAGPKN